VPLLVDVLIYIARLQSKIKYVTNFTANPNLSEIRSLASKTKQTTRRLVGHC